MDEPGPVILPWRRGWAPVDRRLIREWARGLDLQGDYARTGPFRIGESIHLIEPFDALSHPDVRMVNIRKATQTFGSGIGDIFFHWVMTNAPGPFMANFQGDDEATEHFETRIRPTMEANAELAATLLRLKRKRQLYKFPRMNAYFQGANEANLQRKSIRYAWNSEIHIWGRGMLQDAFARTGDFARRCKILNESQAGVVGDDEDLNWDAGRKHELAWRCRCGCAQPLVFFATRVDRAGKPILDSRGQELRAGVIWNADARRRDGRWDIARAAGTARLVCTACGVDYPDVLQTWRMVEQSKHYLCTTPDIPVKNSSYRWTSLVNGDYGFLVEDFLKASEAKKAGAIEPLKKVYQKKLVIPWDDKFTETPAILSTGEYLQGEPWTEATHHFLTADYQEGRGHDSEHYWVEIRGWRKANPHAAEPRLRVPATRMLFYGRLNTPDEIRAKQLKFGIKDRAVCVDGGDRLLYIAGICARFGWTILVGDDVEIFRHAVKGRKKPVLRAWSPRKRVDPGRGTKLQGRTFAWLFYWSNPSVKNITWRNRHGHGIEWSLPADLPQHYRDQIDAEVKVRVIDKKTGQLSYIWRRLHPDNHAWDDENMQTTCALIARIINFDLEDNSKPDAKAKDLAARRDNATPVAPHDQDEQLTLLPNS